MTVRSLGLIMGLICAVAASAAEPEREVTWLKNNAPPFYLIDAPDGETGFGDRIQSMLERALPQYRHRTVQMPLSRLEQSWGRYAPLCFATMIHEPPLNHRYQLSAPYVMYLPHGLITTRAFARTLQTESDGAVSLSTLLDQQVVSLGHIAGRTYGSALDGILNANRDQLDVVQRVGANETTGALAMLQHRRFDVIIEYGFVLNHMPTEMVNQPPLTFVPISETRGQVILGAVGCSNSPAGHEVLAAINEALPPLMRSEEYLRAVSRWLVPATMQAEYWRRYDEALYPSALQ